MSANVETMFYTRTKPWHGMGTCVEEAPDSKEALRVSGLDWNVIQQPIQTNNGLGIPGYRANIRESDRSVLGVVSDRYKVVQNRDAFSFTDALLGEGVTYETAGSLQGGKKIWLLAKLPEKYVIGEDEINPYLVFMNTHDGTGSIKVAMTPIRVVCQNTLNLALETAQRSWAVKHIGEPTQRLQDARNTLFYASSYMRELESCVAELSAKKLADQQVYDYINALFPLIPDASEQQRKNILKLKEDLKERYFEAPDLQHVGKNAYRFVNAVSDFATHARPLRMSENYRENLFSRTVDGNVLIDRAFEMMKAA